MKLLWELITTLADNVRERLVPKPPELTSEQLAQAQLTAAGLIQVMHAEGWKTLSTAWQTRDSELLEALAEPGTWEQHLERRGALRGHREAVGMIDQLIREGLQAEAELERRAKAR